MKPVTIQRLSATILFTAAIAGALLANAVPALLAGLLAFALTSNLLARLRKGKSSRWIVSHELHASLVVGLGSMIFLAVLGAGIVKLLGGETLQGLLLTLANAVKEIKQYLPVDVAARLPDSVLSLKELVSEQLTAHAGVLAGVSTHVLHSLVLTVVGWLIGVLAAVRVVTDPAAHASAPAFQESWAGLWHRMGIVFEGVAFAQAKIAALNAFLSAVFLLVVAPLAGWHIPYSKTLVLATFICGLLPIVGNLVSNTMVVLLALGVSLPAAIAALVFLVVIHKLEYFFSARIQGQHIGAQAWELMIALFLFEILFGAAGMVAAPIVYAFVKNELRLNKWIA